jgi:hypothetical protein
MLHNFKHMPWPVRLAIAGGFLLLLCTGLILASVIM